MGIHEQIALVIRNRLIDFGFHACVEGPPEPVDGWANVHVAGLGNFSITITVYNGVVVVSPFGDSLGYRAMRMDHYLNCRARHEYELNVSDSIDRLITLVNRLLLDNAELPRLSVREIKEAFARNAKFEMHHLSFGKPYYVRITP